MKISALAIFESLRAESHLQKGYSRRISAEGGNRRIRVVDKNETESLRGTWIIWRMPEAFKDESNLDDEIGEKSLELPFQSNSCT